jgi:cytochrome c-type biogenesis protein
MHASVGVVLATFVAGLASFFSPCVAPLMPAYMGYLSGMMLPAGARPAAVGGAALAAEGRPVAAASLLFVAGFSAAFVALGLLSASFGGLLAAYQPVLQTLAGIVMVVMGAFLLNLLPRGTLALLLREARVELRPGRLAVLGRAAPFALGIVFAAGWTPCIGPVLASVLAYVGAQGDRTLGTLLLSVYALGFALPFLAVGLGWTHGLRAVGWARRHGHAISIASGVVLVLVGVIYLTGEVTVFASWAQRLATPERL